MKFQVQDPHGVPKMSTEYDSCIPYKHLQSLEAAGYKLLLDGKKVTAAKLLSMNSAVMYIRCIETGQVFRKQSDAARALSIDPAQVSDSLKTGKRRSGYTFERVSSHDYSCTE